MRTALRTVLLAPPSARIAFDPDTRAYITAVESADGQALEPGVRTALDAFVRGCKADGIWDAIKASCIMAGARTLEGALVPLKGTAPTNFNFVSDDYNRKTGLVGNGSTKYLDSGRLRAADPQNNNHAAVYGSAFPASFSYYMGALNYHFGFSSGAIFSRNNASSTGAGTYSASANLVGVSRAASNTFTTRAAGASSSSSVISIPTTGADHAIFAANLSTGISGRTQSRLAFYSIGESLDLALLDARVTTLVNTFASTIP
jgi:hypothetical protein